MADRKKRAAARRADSVITAAIAVHRAWERAKYLDHESVRDAIYKLDSRVQAYLAARSAPKKPKTGAPRG